MVAGCDKYMQIVRCFRDEDPRADRQAEFTQLDVEMAFIDTENIIKIMGRPAAADVEGNSQTSKFPSDPAHEYDEAMSKYGSDRPDLRFGMPLSDITEMTKGTGFKVFSEAAMVKCIAVPAGAS